MPSDRARLYHQVLSGYLEVGVAPNYLEIAKTLDWSPDHARDVLQDVVALGLPVWLHPGTDLIASFAPFSSLPTLYRISIDGLPHGYAQCGLESLAVSWLFPDSEVRIDSPCPDCAEPISLVMSAGNLLSISPDRAVAHINVPVAKWRGQYPLA